MGKAGLKSLVPALIGSVVMLAACTPVQHVQIEEHHLTNSAVFVGRTVFVALPEGKERGVLAHRDYRQSVIQALRVRGARIAGENDRIQQAEKPLLVSFGYRISDGQKVIEEEQVPEYETFTRKVIRNGQPVFLSERRFVGYRRETYTRTVFTAELTLLIRDGAQDGKPVIYEANAVTSGGCGALAPLIRPLALAILTEFPGISGKVRRKQVEVDEC